MNALLHRKLRKPLLPAGSIVPAVSILLATALLGACGASSSTTETAAAGAGASDQPKTVTIGYSPPNQSAPLLIGLGHGLQEYSKSQGNKVLVADPNNNPTTQVQQLNNWIQLGQVQAIWAIPLNTESLKPVFEKARAKGIAVLVTGQPKDYGMAGAAPGLSFSIIDYLAYGTEMGESIGKCANARLGGKANVVFLPNPSGSVGNSDVEKGLMAGLAKVSPGSKVVATADNKNDRLKSQQATSSAIQANAEVNAVAGGNDESTLGSLGAFKQAGKDPTKSCIVGSGGNDEALGEVKKGNVYAVVAIQFEQDLKQNVDKMTEMVRSPETVGTQLYTPLKTVTK